jgi:hypothetical protein
MRTIRKPKNAPQELRRWVAANRETPQNLVYGGGGFPSEQIRERLLSEQAHLCAYTMKRLKTKAECHSDGLDTTSSCHIEHVLPQARKVQGEDIDYKNMVACFPPSRSSVACEYGAVAKKNYDPATHPFCSPLSLAVDQNFCFDKQGYVAGRTAKGRATVTVLKLNHQVLVDDRAAVIKGYIEPRTGRKISAATARVLARAMLKPDGKLGLPPFCVAASQALLAYAAIEERRAIRLKTKTNAAAKR